MQFVLPYRVQGLSVGDFAFRLYLDGESIADPGIATVALGTPGGSEGYRVEGLPDGSLGTWYTLTWSIGGVGGAYRWPDQPGTPPSLINPVRASGLALADFGFVLYLDGVPVSSSGLVLEEVGLPPEYRIVGLPAAPAGSRYALSWEHPEGFYQLVRWPEIQATSTGAAISSSFDRSWRKLVPRIHAALGGESITFRRDHGLIDPVAGYAPDALAIDTAGSAGATTISLRLPNSTTGDADPLKGILSDDIELTIAGTTYTVTSPVEVESRTLFDVPIAPALAADVAIGDAVDVSSWSEWTVSACLVRSVKNSELKPHLIDAVSYSVDVPREGATRSPKIGDVIVRTGSTGRIMDFGADWEGGWCALVGSL